MGWASGAVASPSVCTAPIGRGWTREAGGSWDKLVAPRDEELASIAVMVQDLLAAGPDVYLNVNNHYEGSAPLTIERLVRLIGS